ncbi:serine palmitoyltransferase [Lactarius sanguifluus]|nr:serine palmitoyltransferase [Lactarius sanguifluus]
MRMVTRDRVPIHPVGLFLFAFQSCALIQAESVFYKIPGSHVIARYKSSHQTDPRRTVLETLLALFAVQTLRTRADSGQKHLIHFSEKTPEPLGAPLTPEGQSDLASVPVVSGANGPRPKLANTGKHVLNLASYDFTGLETIKVRAIETLRKYGFGCCCPLGFYGTIDVHMDLERGFIGVDSRGDIAVADWGIDFTVQKGLHISLSTVRWLDRNDLKSLEDMLLSVEKEPANVADLLRDDSPSPRIQLKHNYKYRLILDESISFGILNSIAKATQIHMIVGSVANGLNSGGFCAGSRIVMDHQHINGASFVFSTAVPVLLAEDVCAILSVLDQVEAITIPTHAASPIIHIYLWSAAMLSAPAFASAEPPDPATPAPRGASSSGIPGKERLQQGIVGGALAQGIWTDQARRLRGKELIEARPSIWLAVTAALSRKECERDAGVIKATVVKVLTKRK